MCEECELDDRKRRSTVRGVSEECEGEVVTTSWSDIQCLDKTEAVMTHPAAAAAYKCIK